MVELTIRIPDETAKRLGETPDLASRALLELAAVEGYRSGQLSRGQVRRMLQLSWHENEEFLANHDCFRDYTVADLEEDRKNLQKILDQ